MGEQAVYQWKFFRAGGVDQVLLCNGADVEHLRELDQKLWVALACPAHGVELLQPLLDHIDTDHDGRIRAPEILDAIEWLKRCVHRVDVLFEGGDALKLSELNIQTLEGLAVLAGARRILADLGRPEAEAITLADLAKVREIF